LAYARHPYDRPDRPANRFGRSTDRHLQYDHQDRQPNYPPAYGGPPPVLQYVSNAQPDPNRAAPEKAVVVFLDNNPRAFGMRVRLAMGTSTRLVAPLPPAEVRHYEDQRLLLQARFSNLPQVPQFVDVLLLFDDVVSWAAAYFRDTATGASLQGYGRVAQRRLQQSKGLDDGARKVKEMASALAGPDTAVKSTYLKWAIAGILGFTTSSETEKILKEARMARRPPDPPAPPAPAYYTPPRTYQPPPYQAQPYQYQAPPHDPRRPPPAQLPPPAYPPPPQPAPRPPPQHFAQQPPSAGQPPPAPARNRGIGRVIPGCMSVIGTNVPYAMNSAGKTCYLCGQLSHLAFSCYLSAPVRLGEPFPGWTAEGTKVPHLWANNTDITKECAELWIDYINRHRIAGNPDPTELSPLPDFAAVARG
jgi:hypothetical protein